MFWRIASDAPLSLAGPRAAVSIAWVFPQALASAALPFPRGIRVAPPQERDQLPRGPPGVTPFPLSLARTFRATLSTGFHDRAPWAELRLPGSYPVPFGFSVSAAHAGSHARWLNLSSLALPMGACEASPREEAPGVSPFIPAAPR